MTETRLLDWNAAAENGLLQKINEEVLKPNGYCIVVSPDGTSPGVYTAGSFEGYLDKEDWKQGELFG